MKKEKPAILPPKQLTKKLSKSVGVGVCVCVDIHVHIVGASRRVEYVCNIYFSRYMRNSKRKFLKIYNTFIVGTILGAMLLHEYWNDNYCIQCMYMFIVKNSIVPQVVYLKETRYIK